MATRIVLVRHAQSNLNVGQRLGGPNNCTGLSPDGIEQAEQLAKRLAGEGIAFDALFVSPVLRARETADILSRAVGVIPVAIDGLAQLAPGEWEGEYWDVWGPQFIRMLTSHAHEALSPGGETMDDFCDRAEATLRKLAGDHEGQCLLAVTHGEFVWASVARMANEAGDFIVENASLTEWEVSNGRWRLTRYNDHTHLSA